MRHVSRTHRVALDWLFDRINLDPKIQIKYIDTKNQLADILTKGNFTLDELNHLLCLFNISHFSSTECSETMAKRFQHDSGEERVKAKSRPMMNLIANDVVERIILDFSQPGEEMLWKSKSLEYTCWERGSDRRNPISASTEWKLPITIIMSNSWKASLQQATQSGMTTVRGLLKSGKLILRCTSERSDPMKLLGERHEKFDLRCEWGNASWQTRETRKRFSRRSMAWTIRQWKRWSRIGTVCGIKIIRESGEWSGVKKTEKFKCYRKCPCSKTREEDRESSSSRSTSSRIATK